MTGNPAGLEFGQFVLHYYSLFIVVGVLIGASYSYLRARQSDQDPEFLVDFLTWGILFALLFARTFYIWNPPPSIAEFYDRDWYLSHPLDLQTGGIAFWNGGLGAAGGLLGMLFGFGLVLWRNELPFRNWAKILLPGVLLTLAITPWGSLLIRQMVGRPTTLPWGIIVDPWPAGFEQPGAFPAGATGFHPLPAYLAIWALLCFVIFLALPHVMGGLFDDSELMLPSMLYLIGVFALDFLRLDVNTGILSLTGMQWLALALIVMVPLEARVRNRFVSIKTAESVAGGAAED